MLSTLGTIALVTYWATCPPQNKHVPVVRNVTAMAIVGKVILSKTPSKRTKKNTRDSDCFIHTFLTSNWKIDH